MEYSIYIIIKGTLFVTLIYLGSYIIEKVTGLRLLIDSFKWEKSKNNAEGAAGWNGIFVFFLTNLIILLYDLSQHSEPPLSYSIWKWLLIIIPLTILFSIVFYRFTNKDSNREDNDYSD
jgi:hypothetical protein